jgi:hypothetical protein
LSSGNIETDYINPFYTTANWKPPQITNLHRQGGPKLLHGRARCEKTALNAAAEFLKSRSRVHDIAVEDDRALYVADLADDHRSKM